jgi:hypothetical protein
MLTSAFHAVCAVWPDQPTSVLLVLMAAIGYGLRCFVRLDPAQRSDIIRLFKAVRNR